MMSSKKKGKTTKHPKAMKCTGNRYAIRLQHIRLHQKTESPANAVSSEQEEENQESAEERFEQELNWCIEQILLGFEHQNPNSKQAYEAVKILKILRSDKAPMIKKRQAMRNAFGDYRQKMKAEERKTIAKLKKVSLTPVKDKPGENACFYRKSLSKQGKCQTSVKDSELEKDNATGETKTLTSSSSDVSQNGISSETGSDFKFNRSNNAFTFNFDQQQQQQQDSENSDSTELNNAVNGLKLNKCASDSNQKQSESDTEMIDKCSQKHFKMIKTDNTFRFNFQVQDS